MITKTKPTAVHTAVTRTADSAVPGSPSHPRVNSSRPPAWSARFSHPRVGEKIHPHTTPTATVGSTYGRKNTTRYTAEPRWTPHSSRARPSPRTSGATVPPMIHTRLLRKAAHTSGSPNISVKLPRPTHGGDGSSPSKSTDRKSTRLNSSHANISYAVFCLKKKKHV